jgi:4-amino-4-deoxy-L-arabinose transferase-like glycosyltransferase
MTAGVQVYEAVRVEAAPKEESRRHVAWQPLTLAGVLCFTVSVNAWWIAAHRSGLPFDIDESGYLQRSIRDGQALHANGLGGLWSALRLPDPQAPLLPMTGGVIRWITGAGPYGLLNVNQLFYVVAVVAAYWAGRAIMNRNWSLVAALMVATVPGLIESSRGFSMAIAATASLTAALAAQVHTDRFRSWSPTLLWGVLLGLASLSRTIVLAFLPGLLVAAVLTLVVTRATRRQILHAVAGLSVGLLIAGAWYTATWHLVLRYLTSYGYGPEANRYGASRSVLSIGWWTYRLHRAVDTELFVPMTLAVLACIACGLVTWWVQRRRPRDGGAWEQRALRFLRTPEAIVVIFVVWGYLVLSTTDNSGFMFELPFIPAVVVLAVHVASRSVPRMRPYLATVCVLAAAISFAGMSDALPGVSSGARSVSIGSFSATAFDGRGSFLGYASGTGGACRPHTRCVGSGTTTGETTYLAEWLAPSQRMTTLLHDTAARHDCDPVVFFAIQDPLFNTNTVDLDYQLRYLTGLPTGLLKPAYEVEGEAPLRQLNDPNLGQPNLVITGSPAAASGNFSPHVGERATIQAVRSDGFVPAAGVRLPDGRVMTVWWKNRGPCGAARP